MKNKGYFGIGIMNPKAAKIFEKHWTKATDKPLDETTKQHMKYAIEAINEALLLGRSEQLKAFADWLQSDTANFNYDFRDLVDEYLKSL